jgi:hypothetical protein
MITDDPILDLERQLVGTAARTAPAPAPPSRRVRARRLALPAAGFATACVAIAVLLTGGTSTPSLAEAAYAQVDPGSGLVHVKSDTRFYDRHRRYQHVRTDTWYSGDIAHSVATSLGPSSGRAVRYLETVRRPTGLRYYESTSKTLTIQPICRRPASAGRSTSDPIALFRRLYKQGRVSSGTTTTFDGRRVRRLVASPSRTLRLVYLVTPKTGEPVAMVNESGFDRAVTRFSTHDRVPLTSATRAHLALAAHPGATVRHVRGAGC